MSQPHRPSRTSWAFPLILPVPWATMPAGIPPQAGLDMAQLKPDTERPEIAQAIDCNMVPAPALGVTGMPGFVIGKEVVGGLIDIDAMRGYVAAARGK